MIGLIDYNMGNLRSVTNAFEKLGVAVEIVKDADTVSKFDKIILPGVGAFKDAMGCLKERNLDEAVRAFAISGKPLLGICLGMQLLFESSVEFGDCAGLGLIEGEIVKFDTSRFDQRLKVPHMGWNQLHVKKETPLFKGMPESFYLYFVHSFHAQCDDQYTIGKTMYGYEFPSAVQKNNVFGFQPHPEKSHANGLAILKNFVEL
ncbi:imidazole glycerol phosphate synthase subunit HisH [Sulfurospirillum multivorans]|uniref:Imidazole glycerol phosphate synthase subunit HisH n=2 Tax=Sulfurospirillum multivorans TaxID=66821 RepID=A0AA86E3D7_SULMK|nr:imidazole glycerol phosphate synthase subunit HisH [Sulfurospirillum multivorans]AHJ13707.1 imidazole glycerol phosphate synthase subunit HisH [Sulfurospirillum multivorans DSM 12446]QEH07197.1 imidazole glycerol phosphate synthase subunit HisH [Sulfurospirillum multivorans]